MPAIDLRSTAYRPPKSGSAPGVGNVDLAFAQGAWQRQMAAGTKELAEFAGALAFEHLAEQERAEAAADVANGLTELRTRLRMARVEAGQRGLSPKATMDELARTRKAFGGEWYSETGRVRSVAARKELEIRANALLGEEGVQAMAESLARQRRITEERFELSEARAIAFRDEKLLDSIRESKVLAGEDAQISDMEHRSSLMVLQAGRYSDRTGEIASLMQDPDFDHSQALALLEADLDAGSGFDAIPPNARADLKLEARRRIAATEQAVRADRARLADRAGARVEAALLDLVRRVSSGEIGEADALSTVYRTAESPDQVREFRDLVQGAAGKPAERGISPESAFAVRDILFGSGDVREKDAKLRRMQREGKLSVGDYLKFSEKAASGEGLEGAVGSVKKQMADELKALYGEGRLVLGQYGGAPQDFQSNMVPPGLTTEDFPPVTDSKDLEKVQAGKPRSPRADFDPFVDNEEVPRHWTFVSATAFDLEFLEGEVGDYAAKHPNAGRDEIWTYLNENYLYPTRMELARLRLVSERRTERLKPDFGERGTMLRNLQGPPDEPAKRPRDRSRPDPYAERMDLMTAD